MPHSFYRVSFYIGLPKQQFLKTPCSLSNRIPIIPDFDNTGMANVFSCQVFELFQFCISWDLKNLMS